MGNLSRKKTERRYTWQDYLTWPDEERWEVINGEAYDMTLSPTERHQRIVINFGSILRTKLSSSPCQVYVAPLDVYLDDLNFVQPDVFVVCDKAKIRDRIYGVPDIVIEVISPATSLKDKREKKTLHERFRVREYIIVHPDEMFIERYSLADDRFKEPDIIGAEEVLNLSFMEGIDIPLWEVFDIAPPEEYQSTSDTAPV